MTREDKKEIAVKGLFLGLILFVSTLIYLLIDMDMPNLRIVGTFIIPIIFGYCLLGMFLRWMVYRSTIRKEGFHLFSGTAIVYWIWILSTFFMVVAYWIPQIIRFIVLVNIATLLIVWLLNFIYLKNIAKELNSGLKYYSRTLIEDLPKKPQTEDMFMQEIENYCTKNHLSFEIINYGIPAEIKIDNTLYTVKLGQYYSVVGSPVYTLEFHNIASKVENRAN